MSKDSIYQVKVTLKHSSPPIWRRLLVPADTRLSKLHVILQRAFDWSDEHLHVFRTASGEYADPDAEMDDAGDESRVTLAQVAPRDGARLLYEYDFGDSWEHDILVEKVLAPEPGGRYPRCTAGKRAAPPEDVGGVWGYANFVAAMRDPDHPDHEEMMEWVEDGWDPEAFDCDKLTEALQQTG